MLEDRCESWCHEGSILETGWLSPCPADMGVCILCLCRMTQPSEIATLTQVSHFLSRSALALTHGKRPTLQLSTTLHFTVHMTNALFITRDLVHCTVRVYTLYSMSVHMTNASFITRDLVQMFYFNKRKCWGGVFFHECPEREALKSLIDPPNIE